MKVLAVFLIVCACGLGSRVQALCMILPEPPCEAYWRWSAVFTGRVVSVSYTPVYKSKDDPSGMNWRKRITRVAIEEAFRGTNGATEIQLVAQEAVPTPVTLPDGRQAIQMMYDSDCTMQFKEGERYLIYAARNEKTGEFYVPYNRTTMIDKAGDDLAFIRSVNNLDASAMIYGTVVRHDGDLQNGNTTKPVPVPNAKILIKGAEQTFEAFTDAEGHYKASKLPAGTYTVSAQVASPLAVEGQNFETKVVAKGCAQVDFFAQTDGRIAGRLFNERGEPMAETKVDLMPIEQKDETSPQGLWTFTDEKGNYAFKEVPAGKYRLGIRLDKTWDAKFPYPPFYYPGVTDSNKAAIIDLREGEHLTNYDLQLPPPLAERTVEGTVVWEDGHPVANAHLDFTIDEYPHRYGENFSLYRGNFSSDDKGHFSMRVFDGLHYRVKAVINLKGGKQMHADPIDIPPNGDTKDIKLVVNRPMESCERCLQYKRKASKQ